MNGSHGYEFTNFKRFLTSTWCDLKAPATRGKKNSGGLCPPGARLVLDPRHYDRFILLPDTVRGPFVPSFVPTSAWPKLLTGLLSGSVKLVGPSITCMGCQRSIHACKTALHTEGHMMTTDRIGLSILLDHWRRPTNKNEAVEINERVDHPKFLLPDTTLRRCSYSGEGTTSEISSSPNESAN